MNHIPSSPPPIKTRMCAQKKNGIYGGGGSACMLFSVHQIIQNYTDYM